MITRKIDILQGLLDKSDYAASAVAMAQDSAIRIKNEFQQEFEKDIVTFSDLESYLGLKILLTHDMSKDEFELYKRVKV
jgi:hypothetical protein